MPRVSVLVGFLVVAAASSAWAEGAVVKAEGETRTEACNGGAATLEGNRNTLTFTGRCTGITLRGEGNMVSVPLTAGAPIDIEGNRNRLRTSGPAGASPRLRIAGSFNEVAPDARAPAPAADTASIAGDNQTVELDCGGKSVTLQGVRSKYRLRGACSALTVRGEANTVQVDLAPSAQVLIEGNGIVLTYTVRNGGTDPAATVRGMGSTVDRVGGGIQTASVASGGETLPVLMNDLDGIVVEPGTLVKLPAAVFSGAGLAPAGETQLGRLVKLIAMTNPKGIRLTGRDPTGGEAARPTLGLIRGWLAAHEPRHLPIEDAVESGPVGVDVLLLR